MDFLNQQWFWTGAFTILSASITFFGIYLKERFNRTSKIKIEKLKIYEEKYFNAYVEVYDFISTAYTYFDPTDDNPRKSFIDLMRKHFFIHAKKNYPFIQRNIREKLKILETQYDCIHNPDFDPDIPFDVFIKTKYISILNELNKTIENLFDKWEKEDK